MEAGHRRWQTAGPRGGVRSAPLTPPGAARVTAGGCLAALAHVTALGAGRL